jgi:hypothetical protein
MSGCRMIRGLRTTAMVLCAVGVSLGCHHVPAAAAIVPVPVGLDSAGVERWLADQRWACRGRLVMLWDEGGAARNFDSATTIVGSRYHAGLEGVLCRS